jgi:hypothetical protein
MHARCVVGLCQSNENEEEIIFMSIKSVGFDQLQSRLTGPIFTPSDEEFADELAPFNPALTLQPDAVVGAANERDLVETVRFAREYELPLSVQATGHGGYLAVASGLMISTKRLNAVAVDPESGIATIGAGAVWGDVLAAADPHGWFPIAGTSGTVGAVGLLLGGGLGPFARSHGYASDYLVSAKVITGDGELVTASEHQNPDLLWALKGGKKGLGVVSEAQVQLVRLDGLYGGALLFAAEQIEPTLRAWVDWTVSADPSVSTSVAIQHFPPLDFLPEHLRGRSLLALRFAYPGSAETGERLAAPLRAAAPVYLDSVGVLPPAQFTKIHNDPTTPAAAVSGGGTLRQIDQEFVTAFLNQVGLGTGTPFLSTEIRHLGAATKTDVPGGSAAGGRSADFVYSYVAVNPAKFATEVPPAAEALRAALAPWTAAEGTIHFNRSTLGSPEEYASSWSPETFTRLEEIRHRFDPAGIFRPRF